MNKTDSKIIHILELGRTAYRDCWDLQKRYVTARAKGEIPDTIILTEHEPVITLGRGTDRKNLLADSGLLKHKGVELFEIERGGDITFHGPGQLVVYPIINLTARNRDMHKYLRDLENVTINTLGNFGLNASTKEGLTGVWVEDSKVAAIGVGVSHWVTYHGLALNINTDLDYFKLINPCGITEYPVGSMFRIMNRRVSFDDVTTAFTKEFIEYFGYDHSEKIEAEENNTIR